MRITTLALASVLLLACGARVANEPLSSARVERVLDGDSLILEAPGGQSEVRLFGIDAPEFTQAHGKTAQTALAAMLDSAAVRYRVVDVDRFDRQVVELWREGEQDSINLRLVADGHAWVYERYNQDRAYLDAQQRARRNGRGLWARPDPVPPWKWRRQR